MSEQLSRYSVLERALQRIAIVDDADCAHANDAKAMTRIARDALACRARCCDLPSEPTRKDGRMTPKQLDALRMLNDAFESHDGRPVDQAIITKADYRLLYEALAEGTVADQIAALIFRRGQGMTICAKFDGRQVGECTRGLNNCPCLLEKMQSVLAAIGFPKRGTEEEEMTDADMAKMVQQNFSRKELGIE